MDRLQITYIHNMFGNYWIVRNKKKEALGTLHYSKDWKRIVWKQCPDIEMSDDCLDELSLAMKRRLARLLGTSSRITAINTKGCGKIEGALPKCGTYPKGKNFIYYCSECTRTSAIKREENKDGN